MFWQSVVTGLSVLTHWQTYVAGLLFIILCMAPLICIGLLAAGTGRPVGQLGCLYMLVMPIFQVYAMVVFVLTMSPIVLGLSNEAAWAFPWLLTVNAPAVMALFTGKLLVVAVGLALIPLLGKFQSLHSILIGSYALALAIGLFAQAHPELATKNITFWPDLWFVAGLVLVGSAFAWIATILASVLSAVVESKVQGMGHLIMFPLAATFGFIPVFIYGAWLGAQLRAAAAT